MTYSLLWLPKVLRDAGLEVVEHPGWQSRGHGDMRTIKGVLCHHTAGPLKGEIPDLNILVNGRPDLSGPLCNLGLGRSGKFYMIAAGKGWHAGAGNWQGITDGNANLIGIEAENTGLPNDPWPAVQMDAYARGCAAILKHIGAKSIMAAGHKEYALPKGRKSDPSFDMIAFRNNVAKFMSENQEVQMEPEMSITDTSIPAPIRTKNPGAMWGRIGKRTSTSKIVDTDAPIPKKWGSKKTVYLSDGLGQGNNIAVFDAWVQGICAQLDLWRTSDKYKNKRFADAIATWSGGNDVPEYITFCKKRVPGLTEDTIMNDAFWKGPMAIPFLKAQAWHEAGKVYPAPDADWIEAHKRVMSGISATTKATTAGGTVAVTTAVVVTVNQGWSWIEIGLTAFIVTGLATTIVLLVKKLRG